MMKFLKLLLCSALACVLHAEFLVQGSYSMQINDKVTMMSGYTVKYDQIDAKSRYDLSVGYLFNLRNVAVMPVMLEGKSTTFESYLNPNDVNDDNLAPLELLLKPGLRLTDADVYLMLGYQIGDFSQKVEADGHDLSLTVRPNFYGCGYAKGLSDYLDYLAEVKVYYHSPSSYGIDFETMELDPNFVISDAKLRIGLRVKI